MDKPIPEAVRLAIQSNDLYQVLMDVQNGIDSPGLRGMANSAIRRIDSARSALTAAQQQGQAVACECPIPLDDPPNMHAPACVVRQPMQQGGGEVCGCGRPGEYFDVVGRASCNKHMRCSAPPSAPVGVEVKILARDVHYAIRDDGLAPASPADDAAMRNAILRVLASNLAQQPAAVDGAACVHGCRCGCCRACKRGHYEPTRHSTCDCYATQHQEPKS